jgi:ribosomal protein S18 acetylase RimI-like enzyme
MHLLLSNHSLQLRPITQSDQAVLCRIYASTRTEELRQVGWWTPEQKEAFLQFQFDAQHHYYQEHYPDAWFWLLLRKGEVIGRLYLQAPAKGSSVCIVDITLLPAWRNQGIGQQLLLDIMEFATKRGKSITIHVESFNPALRLYKRLGFQTVDTTNAVYHLLKWKALLPQPQIANP